MNNIIKKINTVALVLFMTFAITSTASAGDVSWANPNTYGPIAHVSGSSVVQSTTYSAFNYQNSSSAQPGDKVAVIIYVHNDGDADSANTIVKLTQAPGGSHTSYTFSGSVSGGGASKSGSTTVTLSSSQTLTYIPGSLRVAKDRAANGSPVANDTAVFSAQGLNIGNIPGMHTCGVDALCHQGYVAIGFQVGNAAPQTYQCNDGIDNDGDGYIDFPSDQGCNDATDNNEYNAVNPQTYQCNDGYDNDGDGYTDYPSDPGCSNATDNSEYNAQATCKVDSFYASPSTVESGDTTRLYWTTTNCTQVQIDGITYPVDGNGYFGPLYSNRTYTINATNQTSSDTDTVTVKVEKEQVDDCEIDSFYASPTSVASGGTTRLYWTTTDCTNVKIDGISYPTDGNGYFGPLYSGRTYTINAYNNNSSDSDSEYVSVTNAPTQNVYQCNDGYDNDGDGYTDYPNDPGCSSSVDNDEYNYIAPVQSNPVVTTLNPSNLTSSSARLNGTVFNAGTGATRVYFEWGTDAVSLPNKTSDQTTNGNTTVTYFDTAYGLSTGVTYYYRAAARTANGTIYRGEVKSFRLIEAIIPTTTTIIRPVTTTVVAPVENRGLVLGLGTNLVQLRYVNNNQFTSFNGTFGTAAVTNNVDNPVQNVCVSDVARFVVEYRNISNTVLTNAILHIDIPKDLEFRSSSSGVYNKADNTITINVGTLNPDQAGTVSFDGLVLSSAANRDLLVVPATLSFENPNNGARETAVAYGLATTQNCLRNNLAGFAFGSGFFPNTLIGWLILALVLAALIYFIRRWFMAPTTRYADKRRVVERHYEDLDVPTAPYRH